jgi:transketolase
MQAKATLDAAGVRTRVVSVPSTSIFDRQDRGWHDEVLPRGPKRLAIEAGSTGLWYKYVGLDGAVIGIDRFGESAPAGDLFKHFGFTAAHVVETALTLTQR